ncbi:hypothetical protein RKLH11_3459 [Rhodobacteraceae bacterium KLH11]|nr:hypothetical protein RKLH11_3459 [Rhodobacteraceae bacterium KLH11]
MAVPTPALFNVQLTLSLAKAQSSDESFTINRPRSQKARRHAVSAFT